MNLAAISCFFVEPWRQLQPELTQNAQFWLRNEAALALRPLGRLMEARELMEVGLDRDVHVGDWRSAAISATTLSEIDLALGDVPGAEAVASQSISVADRIRRSDGQEGVYYRSQLELALSVSEAVKDAGQIENREHKEGTDAENREGENLGRSLYRQEHRATASPGFR